MNHRRLRTLLRVHVHLKAPFLDFDIELETHSQIDAAVIGCSIVTKLVECFIMMKLAGGHDANDPRVTGTYTVESAPFVFPIREMSTGKTN